MFSISGERLTMRIRRMAFKALLRQVLKSYMLVSFTDDFSCYVATALSTAAGWLQGCCLGVSPTARYCAIISEFSWLCPVSADFNHHR